MGTSRSLLHLTLILSFALVNGYDRHEKIFSIVNLVRFRHEPCRSTQTITSSITGVTRRVGTCMSSANCESNGGTVGGNCAASFGVCCIFAISSEEGGTVTQNNTYLRNPGTTYDGEESPIDYMIQKPADSSVCQLRLDFHRFELAGPPTESDACPDQLVITEVDGDNPPIICGDNSGQHIYVDCTSDAVELSLTFDDMTTADRVWDIQVTQIPCGSISAAPAGCLQYFTALTGEIATFNYDNAGTASHLSDQDYSICIRPAEGHCCVLYQVCEEDSFSLGNVPADKSGIDNECATDYLSIIGSSLSGNIQTDTVEKYCGGKLAPLSMGEKNAPIRSCTNFNIGVRADMTQEGGTAANGIGACLRYSQEVCT